MAMQLHMSLVLDPAGEVAGMAQMVRNSELNDIGP